MHSGLGWETDPPRGLTPVFATVNDAPRRSMALLGRQPYMKRTIPCYSPVPSCIKLPLRPEMVHILAVQGHLQASYLGDGNLFKSEGF